MQNARKITLTLALIAMIFCSWFKLLDASASQRMNAGLNRALISFASARALNAVISFAQGTEVAIQPMGVGLTLTPGQLLEPVDDLVEKFASLMLAACVAFGIQKMLIIIGGHWLINLSITVFALCWLWFYFRTQSSPQWVSKILLILLMIRFAIPIVTIGTDMLFDKYLAEEYKNNQQAISKQSLQVAEYKPTAQSDHSTFVEDMSFMSYFFKETVGKVVSKVTDAVDVKARAKRLQVLAEKWIEHIIQLIVIFLLQTLIIPLLLIWALYTIVKRSLETEGVRNFE
jgi:hypothetical protein